MKVAVLIPTRGNRPELLENCLRMMRGQTLKPDHIELVIDTPANDICDITWRYRTGYDRLRNKGFDVIALIEDDDYYHPEYLETMVNEWDKAGRPSLIGTSYTIYYHIKLNAWLTMHHNVRSSAMSTLIKADMQFNWCHDADPFTDIFLWKNLKGKIFKPEKHICLGIKHGTTMSGGMCHVDKLERFVNQDAAREFLKANTDTTSFEFYENFTSKIN
jgi:glycosyltransferase involved in cell wall biosynthesis